MRRLLIALLLPRTVPINMSSSKRRLVLGILSGFGVCLLLQAAIHQLEFVSRAADAQAERGSESPQSAAQAGRGGGGFTEPAPLDFTDHEGYVSLFDGLTLAG